MAGFEEQLNSILGNQEAMSQIMALAQSLSGGQSPAQPEALTSPAEAEDAGQTPQTPEAPPPDLSNLLGQVDPKMLQMGMDILHQVQGTEDRNAALINALRPFLREERQVRLDRALKIVRTARLVQVALNTLGGKEGERV